MLQRLNTILSQSCRNPVAIHYVFIRKNLSRSCHDNFCCKIVLQRISEKRIILENFQNCCKIRFKNVKNWSVMLGMLGMLRILGKKFQFENSEKSNGQLINFLFYCRNTVQNCWNTVRNCRNTV